MPEVSAVERNRGYRNPLTVQRGQRAASAARSSSLIARSSFSVPARTAQSLCIGAVTINRRLHLAFRYPHRLFSADAARRFADYYLAQIRLLGTDPDRW